jgi:excisionase family DNA binding protein
MTQEEVAAMFGVTIHAVRKWRQWGWIEFIRVGRTVRFQREQVEKFMADHVNVPA